ETAIFKMTPACEVSTETLFMNCEDDEPVLSVCSNQMLLVTLSSTTLATYSRRNRSEDNWDFVNSEDFTDIRLWNDVFFAWTPNAKICRHPISGEAAELEFR